MGSSQYLTKIFPAFSFCSILSHMKVEINVCLSVEAGEGGGELAGAAVLLPLVLLVGSHDVWYVREGVLCLLETRRV